MKKYILNSLIVALLATSSMLNATEVPNLARASDVDWSDVAAPVWSGITSIMKIGLGYVGQSIWNIPLVDACKPPTIIALKFLKSNPTAQAIYCKAEEFGMYTYYSARLRAHHPELLKDDFNDARQRCEAIVQTVVDAPGNRMRAMGVRIADEANDALEENVKKPLARYAKIGAATTLGAVGLYYATQYASKKIEEALRIPRLAYKTSEKSITDQIGSWFVESKPIPLRHMIFAPKIADKFAELVATTRCINSQIKDGDLTSQYRNLLLAGNIGTGKSLFAQNLAIASGMDYYMFKSSAFLNEKKEHLLDELIVFINKTSKKGVLIFIDEIEMLLSKGNQVTINTFLDYARKRNAKCMFVFSTHRPHELDKMLKLSVDDTVEFTFPEVAERIAILDHYVATHLLHTGVSEQFRDSVLRELTVAAIQEIAEKCSGLSGGELKNIVASIKTFASCSEVKVITPAIVERAVQDAITKIGRH